MRPDPRTIEGSKERAADRGRDQMGFPDLSKPNLGAPAVVESLLRGFLGRVVEIRAAYNADEMDGPESAQAINDAAAQYARIFMGGDGDYGAMPWNSPAQLGAHLSATGYDPDPARSCESFFLKAAGDLVANMALHEDGKMDDETAQFVVDAAVEDGTALLLGLPTPD